MKKPLIGSLSGWRDDETRQASGETAQRARRCVPVAGAAALHVAAADDDIEASRA